MNSRIKLPILECLNSSSQNFSKILRKIAAYVRENPDKVVYRTITQVAEAVNASETSIIRFCRQLGFVNYADFKIALALEVNEQSILNRKDSINDSKVSFIEKRLRLAIDGLQKSASMISEKDILETSTRLKKSKQVLVFGVASSFVTVSFLNYQLNRLGIFSLCFQDTHMACINLSHMAKGDTLVCVSAGGSTKDVIEVAKTGKKNGVYSILITNTVKSPLSTFVDKPLIVSNMEGPFSGGDFCAKINQLFLIDLIVAELVKKYPQCKQNLEKSANSISQLLY